MFLAEVVAVHVDEKYMDEKNAFHMDDIGMFAYEHGTYRELGDKLGTFGYSVRKKPSGNKAPGKKVDNKRAKEKKTVSTKSDNTKAKANKPVSKKSAPKKAIGNKISNKKRTH